MSSVLSAPHFHDEAAAFAHVEALLWPQGPVCPHCGCTGRIGTVKPNAEKRVRMGLKRCGDCKKQFTVRIGTIFEESKLPLHLWLQAMHLLCSSKKGISSHQLMRILSTTYRTAWFLSHRIREAMRGGELAPFGGGGGMVEVDETFIGQDPWFKGEVIKFRRPVHMNKVLTLIDRDTGRARSMVIEGLSSKRMSEILSVNIAKEAQLMTDEANYYRRVGATFAAHHTVNHAKEQYVSKANRTVHTNTVEGFYSIFKRGMKGVYQHCSAKHLHRYAAEFDFRYSNRVALGVDDQERAQRALLGVVGKRLTYR